MTFFLSNIVQAASISATTTTNVNISQSSPALIAARKKKSPKSKVKRRSQPTAKSGASPNRTESTQTISRPAAPTPAVLTPVPIVAPPALTAPIAAEPELTIDVTGERRIDLPKSSPIYTIDRQQINRQGSKNAADALKNLPGFAINDVGYGADIHTGTYYRGASTNQFIILLNGRPINTNINTYHGATDLNSIPVDAIDRIELSSTERLK